MNEDIDNVMNEEILGVDEELADEDPVDEVPVDVDEELADEDPVDVDEELADEDPVDEELADEDPVDEDPVDVDEELADEDPVDEDPVDEELADEDPVDEDPVDEDPVDPELGPIDAEAEGDDDDNGVENPEDDDGVENPEQPVPEQPVPEQPVVDEDGGIRANTFDDIVQEEGYVEPEGLVLLPNENLLTIGSQPSDGGNEITLTQEIVSSVDLPASIKPINTAFDSQFNRLLGLNPSGNKLIEVKAGADNQLNSDTLTEIDVKSLGIKNARGITVGPEGKLYVLDGAAKQIVVIEPDAEGNFGTASTFQIDLPKDVNNPRGIAVHPDSGNFQILSPAKSLLYELDPEGQLIATRDLSELGVEKPGAIVFAPSADRTDAPEALSLYIADKDLALVELPYDELPSPQADTLSIQGATLSTLATSSNDDPLVLVQAILSSQFSPPSPDPSGITYINSTNRLVISDGEVNEPVGIPFEGVNVWDITLSGGVFYTGDTTAFTGEPTGISFDPDFGTNGRFFISDDTNTSGVRGIDIIDPGNNGLPGGGDDSVLGFVDTENFQSFDPEGVTFADLNGQEVLFIADGVNDEVYQATIGGQLINQFDTSGFGLFNPEGIAYDQESNNLFLVGKNDNVLFEVNTSGSLVHTYDIRNTNLGEVRNLAGVTLAPSSNDPNSKSVYISDRGIDNNSDPSAHNDGKIYELALSPTSPPPPPAQDNEIYISSSSSGSIDGISFGDEDILLFEESTGTWSKYFDGNDVLSGDVDAFHIDDDGSILLSLTTAATLPDVGSIEDSDIVRFIPTSLGNDTAGSFEWFFDGSDVGLDTASDDIDAIAFSPDGRLTVSTKGTPGFVSGAKDEDLLIFNDTSFGETTSGSWELYFDGSDVDLSSSSEDAYGAWIDDSSGQIYLTTNGDFTVSGVSGDEADIFAFDPSSTGSNTSGSFSSFFDGSANGFGGELIDAFDIDLI